MWKNIRKKLNDFIFEEIEEELEIDDDYVQHVERLPYDEQQIHTRVTYKYPENEKGKFRFPVIPDQTDFNDTDVQSQRTSFQDDDVPIRKKRTNIKRTKRNEKRIPFETHDDLEPLIHGYRGRKKIDEMEEVPAYVRRKRKKRQQIEREKELQCKQRIEQLESKLTEDIGHTTPDELDEVFRKRDQQVTKDKTNMSSFELSGEENSKNKRETNELKRNAFNVLKETRSKKTKDSEKTISSPERSFKRNTYTSVNDEKRQEASLHYENENDHLHKSSVRNNINSDGKDEATNRKQLSQDDQQTYEATSFMNSSRYLQDTKTRSEKDTNRNMLNFAQAKKDAFSEVATTELSMSDDSEMYAVPDELLNDPDVDHNRDERWLEEQRKLLEQTLTYFNIDAKVVHVTQGPAVTRFEIQPALGVKVSRIRNLADDFKLNMAARDIRIEAPIPGKNTVGIEVPNKTSQIVMLQEIIESKQFKEATSPLSVALGVTIEGKPLVTNIANMPHGLIAGATGSGKSVCINSIILSLLYKATPDEVKLLLIDPKMVELTPYNDIPHLLAPVISDPQAATKALKWAVDEMERRYELFVATGVRNIVKYNEKISQDTLPYIVIIIDELADLMLVSPQEVEDAICRIAQKARACGIHLLLATQRPSVDVITGLIKANIPTRIAFSVTSQVDSRTIIDTNGAEKLLGKGDMLFVPNGTNKRMRLQGPFVSDDEVDRVVAYVRSTGKPNYVFEEEQLLLQLSADDEDELLEDVIQFVVEQKSASTSLLQRRFRIGYNRAARLIDTLYELGIVSGQNGTKPREVLVTKTDIEDML